MPDGYVNGLNSAFFKTLSGALHGGGYHSITAAPHVSPAPKTISRIMSPL